MARQHHYRRQQKEPPELNITTFLNLMVVLVPFLLITAVFSRITILELKLPTGAGAGASQKQQLSIEVIVRKTGIDIGNGKQVLVHLPLLTNEQLGKSVRVMDDGFINHYDLKKLDKYLIGIKEKYPKKTDALVLMEPDIEYRVLISVMDAVRSGFIRKKNNAGQPVNVLQQLVLFPDISIGDAP